MAGFVFTSQIYANKEEIKSLYENDNIEEITKILSQQERIYAITMGEEGALIIKGQLFFDSFLGA